MSDSKELSAEERDTKPTEAALAYFLERWRALPPLVRAATADVLRRQSAISFSREDRDAKDAKELLPRRAAVYLAFRNAHGALHDLACELCRLADEEAERVGQGPLVRAEPTHDRIPHCWKCGLEYHRSFFADRVRYEPPCECTPPGSVSRRQGLQAPPLVVDKERVEKAVVSYSGQDMVGDPGPWEAKPNGHPRCRKCQQPFRPAFAPLDPDTLVPSCKCTPPGGVSPREAKPNADCPYCYVGEDGKMRCKGPPADDLVPNPFAPPPPEEYVANLDSTRTAALFCTCGDGARCSVHPEEKS